MRSAIKRIGNSAGIVIPKPLLAEIGAKAGDRVELAVEQGRLVLQPMRRVPRAGWAEDWKRLAAAGDDALLRPEFANDEDEQLAW